MNEVYSAFPLAWPAGWKRIKLQDRVSAQFNRKETVYRATGTWKQTKILSVSDATERVLRSLSMLRVGRQDVVVSTNIKTRLDGLPYSNQPEPEDTGAAVYWRKNNETKCMAIDQYHRVADNLAAIAATMEAMRAIERHGGAEILNRVFLGFQALPPPKDWRRILNLEGATITLEQAEAKYKELAKIHHPDKGGMPHLFAEISAAITQAREALR
jgi:hypothetical protein